MKIAAAVFLAGLAAAAPSAVAPGPQIATVAADAGLAAMPPAALARRLATLVPLTADKPSEGEWTWSGRNPGAGVIWARSYFQPGTKRGSWSFVQMRLGLAKGSAAATAAALTARLGRAKGRAVQNWSRNGVSVELRDGSFANPMTGLKQPVTLLEIAIPQGEPD